MHRLHPSFTAPLPHETLWRYMDFAKLVALLETRSLYFCGADLLPDSWEGSLSQPSIMARRQGLVAAFGPRAERDIAAQAEVIRKYREFVYVNCWHQGTHETAGMWDRYAKRNDGIAIRTTSERLSRSFSSAEQNIYIGRVNYIDYDHDHMPWGNRFDPFLHKRHEFADEQEVRAVLMSADTRSGRPLIETRPIGKGINVPVDLNTLIDKVYVAPTAQDWITTLVESVARRYALAAPVRGSHLADSPVF